MTSIPVLTTKVKTTTRPPSLKLHKARKHTGQAVDALPFAATHDDAPTLQDVQQVAAGTLARLMKAYALQRMGEQDGR